MSTVQEIEGAIIRLSEAERLELRRWLLKQDREAARKAAEKKVDWSQSACVTRERDPAKQIPAQAVLDALDEIRRDRWE